jgi:hypothetical protein
LIFAATLLVCATALVEILFPGFDYPYHAGWFNVALVAIWVFAAWRARTPLRNASAPAVARIAITGAILGSGIACVATVASGLLGPDVRTAIGAPGQRLQLTETGDWLEFPLTGASSQMPVVALQRGNAVVSIDRTRQVGAFVFRSIPRSVVSVDARDAAGNRLTITQPDGASFLSPVLLMTQTQNISGLNLPFDGFSVPAAKRNVKAVLFSARAAAAIRGLPSDSGPAVLFAVDDERGQPLAHGIALSAAGRAVNAGGLFLTATVLQFPAIQIVSAPPALPVRLGTLLTLAGIVAATAWRSRSMRVPAPQA